MLKKIALLIIWGCFILIVFISSFNEQIMLPENFKKEVNIIFPQGWSFFTKDPRSYRLLAYSLNGSKIEKLSIQNQSFSNIFGLSRKARVIGYESSIIANKILPKNWKDMVGERLDSLVGCKSIKLKPEKNFKYLTGGYYIFKLYKPIPYTWANKKQEMNNPSKLAKVEIVSN